MGSGPVEGHPPPTEPFILERHWSLVIIGVEEGGNGSRADLATDPRNERKRLVLTIRKYL